MKRNKAPWYFWLVALAALAWNSFGLMDFIMTQSRNTNYMSSFNQQQLEFFYSFPLWVNIAWAVGTIGAMLGSLLLLLRHRWCITMFWLSLAGLILTTTHNFFLSEVNMYQIAGRGAIMFTAIIYLVALMLILYAIDMRNKKVLI